MAEVQAKKKEKQLAVIKVQRRKGVQEVYIKAPFLSVLFKGLSESKYGEARVKHVYHEDGSEMYSYYVLPSSSVSTVDLRATPDTINTYGYLRSPGLSRGLYVPIHEPLPNEIADKLAERLMSIIQELHSSYINEYTITRTIVGEAVEVEEVNEQA